VKEFGAALASFSPHRFYGPKGVGVLYRNKKARIVSMMHGGVQEGGRRAGTENVPAIVGGGVAAEIALTERDLPGGWVLAISAAMFGPILWLVYAFVQGGPLAGSVPAVLTLAFVFILVVGLFTPVVTGHLAGLVGHPGVGP